MARVSPVVQVTASVSKMFSVGLCRTLIASVQKQGFQSGLLSRKTPSYIVVPGAQLSSSCQHFAEEKVKNYDPPSPYRRPGPRRFGYEVRLHQGGLLPRSEKYKSVQMPHYEPKDNWSRKRALFGQNDYIDILGEGDVRPYDLLKGPKWLLGFRGNEMQRVIRQLKFEGAKLKFLYPTEYNRLQKRLRYLYKYYNHKRSHYHR